MMHEEICQHCKNPNRYYDKQLKVTDEVHEIVAKELAVLTKKALGD